MRFFRLNRNERRLFLEAVYETFVVFIITNVRSARKYTPLLGCSGAETEEVELAPEKAEQALRIKTAVARCRHLMWARKCLVVSFAAKRMLGRQGIPATLYLGVAKDEKGKMIAHAWLRSGNIWVTGGRNRHRFTTVGFFS